MRLRWSPEFGIGVAATQPNELMAQRFEKWLEEGKSFNIVVADIQLDAEDIPSGGRCG